MVKEIFFQANDGVHAGFRYRGVFHIGLTADELAKRLQIPPGSYEVQIDPDPPATARLTLPDQPI
jgi:hypothetical protein